MAGMVVINILTPIILLIALGTVLRRTGFASEAFFKESSRLVFWIGLPALLFRETALAEPQLGTAFGISLILLAGMAACMVLAHLLGRGLGLARPSLASFIQGAYRGNLAYVGLPVVLYALAAAGQDTDRWRAIALLATVPVIPAYNILAVVILANGSQQEPINLSRQGGKLLLGVLSNPLIISCLAGLAYAYSGLPLPLLVDRSLSAVGQMALPLSLLAIGASLRLRAIREGGMPALFSSLIKVLVAPAVGYVLARWMGLASTGLQVALLYLAMPTAVMSYVMAESMGADGQLAGSIVVISTLLAMPVLALVLLLT